jgi:hypothetical protein
MTRLKQRLLTIIDHLPYVRGLVKRLAYYNSVLFFPPEHYYSPIVAKKEVKENEAWIWGGEYVAAVDGINLNLLDQQNLLSEFKKYLPDFDFPLQSTDAARYHFDNEFFREHDAFILFSFIRHYAPQQVIEIGSGFSSALMLETSERFHQGHISMHFIEPFPEERLNAFVTGRQDASVYPKKIQEVELAFFEKLETNDILFVDSSHVSKTGSDLNYILFKILPSLASGVIIHFHDIFYPFEYPKEWVYLGRSWNEAYLLRAFMMHNEDYKILYFNDAMTSLHPELTKDFLALSKSRGSGLWIRKVNR